MPTIRRALIAISCLCLLGIANSLAQDSAETDADAKTKDKKQSYKVSTFAPVKDTEAQLKYFIEKIGRDLENKEDFEESVQRRIGLDSSTVAVLALTLGMHDEKTKYKPAASKLIKIASKLVDSADEYDAAKKTHARLAAAFEEPVKGEPVSWDEPVADLAMLMQQVPILNEGLRRGVNDKRRFARNAKKNAARAVTLAAIAHASMMDTNYCSDEAEEKVWKKICADMRDSLVGVSKALLKKNQDAAKKANAKVVETCDACHHKFRD